MMSQGQTSETDSQRAKVIAWVPGQQRIDHERTFTDFGQHVLTSASQDAALFISFADGFSSSQTRLLGFSDNSLVTHSGQPLFNYTVLDPAYFYSTSDFKFYSKDGSLQSRGFPVSLAPVPSGNRTGRYHVLTVGGSGVN